MNDRNNLGVRDKCACGSKEDTQIGLWDICVKNIGDTLGLWFDETLELTWKEIVVGDTSGLWGTQGSIRSILTRDTGI